MALRAMSGHRRSASGAPYSSAKRTTVRCRTPQCLAGPAWGRERWVYEAAALGMPTVEIARNSEKSVLAPAITEVVTVIGDTILGAPENELRAHAAQLARRT